MKISKKNEGREEKRTGVAQNAHDEGSTKLVLFVSPGGKKKEGEGGGQGK